MNNLVIFRVENGYSRNRRSGFMNNAQWYKQWFNQKYLQLYPHRDCQEAEPQYRLIINKINPPKTSSILDLGCGAGRYVNLFHQDGYRIVGMDLSRVLIESGRRKFRNLNWIVGDMRHIPGRFDLILSLFTSFGYFESQKENEQVVTSVVSSLFQGGVFWLDFLNRDQVIENLVTRNETELADGTLIVERRRIEYDRIIKEIHINSGSSKEVYMESVLLLSREDLEKMFQRNRLTVEKCYGNYSGEAFAPNSERLIMVGRKDG